MAARLLAGSNYTHCVCRRMRQGPNGHATNSAHSKNAKRRPNDHAFQRSSLGTPDRHDLILKMDAATRKVRSCPDGVTCVRGHAANSKHQFGSWAERHTVSRRRYQVLGCPRAYGGFHLFDRRGHVPVAFDIYVGKHQSGRHGYNRLQFVHGRDLARSASLLQLLYLLIDIGCTLWRADIFWARSRLDPCVAYSNTVQESEPFIIKGIGIFGAVGELNAVEAI